MAEKNLKITLVPLWRAVPAACRHHYSTFFPKEKRLEYDIVFRKAYLTFFAKQTILKVQSLLYKGEHVP